MSIVRAYVKEERSFPAITRPDAPFERALISPKPPLFAKFFGILRPTTSPVWFFAGAWMAGLVIMSSLAKCPLLFFRWLRVDDTPAS